MKPASNNISCTALTDALTTLAHNTSPDRPQTIEAVSRKHTCRLADTAEAVREVARKMSKTRVKWDVVKSVMLITKPGDASLIGMTRDIALFLIETPRNGLENGITVYVDEKLKSSKRFHYDKILQKHPLANEKLKFWNPELCASKPKSFDFIVTLGGDGTVLFSSWLFQSYVPPVIPFHLGSLGFLTPFDFDRFRQHLFNAMDRGVRINLRGRLTCTVYRRVPHTDDETKSVQLRNVVRDPVTGKFSVGGWCQELKKRQQQAAADGKPKKFGEVDGDDVEEGICPEEQLIEPLGEERQVPCFTTVPAEKYHVINDLVVDRGPSPFVSLLELFGDDKHLTTVQADGLAISTPTGSTAYSLSAGGSLTHPDIHAILITPICPHTLSFRPTLVPDSMELRICVPFNSRNTAWVSFDGRGRVEIKQGDHIKVTASRYPFPTVCKEDQATDWFNSLQNCLHWNRRERQKSFAVVESHPTHSSSKSLSSSSRSASSQHIPLTRSGFPPVTRGGTQSPPPPSTPHMHHNNTRKSSGSSTTSGSSDAGHDEVFGMFYDDDSQKGRYRGEKGTGRRCSNCGEDNINDTGSNYESTDSFESDDDSDDSAPEVFNGWSDEEIIKARYTARIAKELEKVSIKDKVHPIIE
ncbi:ATP-NAD kinase-like domain-containing protein [Helicostylum pulchrum]|nr:ATP-NAD kinase-like domain-containing protein [Helicostylum pulchrum]